MARTSLFAVVLAAFLSIAATLPAASQANLYPSTLSPNTVIGRTGINAGPPQAIPFSLLIQDLSGIPNTWSALQTFTAGIACSITNNPLGMCFNALQNTAGGTYSAPTNLNSIAILENLTGTGFFLDGVAIAQTVYGGSGGRQALQVALNLTGWQATSNNFAVAIAPGVIISANAGGNSGAYLGNIFGLGPECFATSGATYIAELSCQENDIVVATGANVKYLSAVKLVQLSNHANHADTLEGAFIFTNASGAVGWNYLIYVGSFAGGANPSACQTASCNVGTFIYADNVTRLWRGIDLSSAVGSTDANAWAIVTPGFGVTWGGVVAAVALNGQFSTISGGTIGGGSTNPFVSINGTWNTTGVVDAALFVNVTNTASGAGSKLFDLQVGGSSKFNVDKNGNVVLLGTINLISYPTTLTSGGVLYASSTTAITSSALLGANCIVYGGGAGTAPATSSSNCPTVSSAGAVVIPTSLILGSVSTADAILNVYGTSTVLGKANVAARFGLARNNSGFDTALLLGTTNGNAPFIGCFSGETTNVVGCSFFVQQMSGGAITTVWTANSTTLAVLLTTAATTGGAGALTVAGGGYFANNVVINGNGQALVVGGANAGSFNDITLINSGTYTTANTQVLLQMALSNAAAGFLNIEVNGGSGSYPALAAVFDSGATLTNGMTFLAEAGSITLNAKSSLLFQSNGAAVGEFFASGCFYVGASPSDCGANNLRGQGSILSASASGGVGYSAGAGGAVTQATSRTTGVTLNTVTGDITLVSAAGSASFQSFVVSNTAVGAHDGVRITQLSGADKYQVFVTAVSGGTSFTITFATTGGTTTEQPIFHFEIIKGANSFLLKRDLDPASNDNSPAFLTENAA